MKGNTQRHYADEEQKAALELAAAVGVGPAAAQLDVTRRTLYNWMNKWPKLWSDLRAEDPTAQRRGTAMRLEDLAERYRDNEHELLELVEKGHIVPKDAKELAALLKAMGSSRQTATLGARSASGEPDQVEHTLNFPALEAAMERLLGAAPTPALAPADAEAEAEEIG